MLSCTLLSCGFLLLIDQNSILNVQKVEFEEKEDIPVVIVLLLECNFQTVSYKFPFKNKINDLKKTRRYGFILL